MALKIPRVSVIAFVVTAVVFGGSWLISATTNSDRTPKIDIAPQQVPSWSKEDLNFFLHGSMSTEVVPESVLRAFIKT